MHMGKGVRGDLDGDNYLDAIKKALQLRDEEERVECVKRRREKGENAAKAREAKRNKNM